MKRNGVGFSHMRMVDQEALEKCAELYCSIWKEDPWNELHWKPAHVMRKIKKSQKQETFSGFLAVADGEIVGFSWGFGVTMHSLQRISSGAIIDPLFLAGKRVFYVAELGVAGAYRNLGIAKNLSGLLLDEALAIGMNIAVLRTDELAVPARRLYARLGFQEMTTRDEKFLSRTYWMLDFG